MPQLRIALAQTDSHVGDLANNVATIKDYAAKAAQSGAQVVVFPEMAVTGYPIEDLAQRASFVRAAALTTEQLATDLDAAGLGELHVVVGTIGAPQSPTAKPTNRAAVLFGGQVIATYDKQHLPNYGVFDEYRIFDAGTTPTIFEVDGHRLGLVICEDLWQDHGPSAQLANQDVHAVIALNASPYEEGKSAARQDVAARGAATAGAALLYVNAVGGQDDLVFDGGSFAVGADGQVLTSAPQFDSQLLLCDLTTENKILPGPIAPALEPDQEVYQALVLGLRGYVEKNGFKSVVLGASGGIDSALVATVAADAIGGDRVYGIAMPSKYSSEHSIQDAEDLLKRLGGHYRKQPIAPIFDAFQAELALTGVSEENLQARIRGVILMGLSNQEGHLVLAPGNKSELAVGYSTIYGDAVGGYGPIKDVFKSRVWQLARWRNNHALDQGLIPPIPESSITKPPSAELRPGQVDQDSLPPYDILDAVLAAHLEHNEGRAELLARGFDSEVVERVVSLVDRAEWKRRQYPLGTKITTMAFGRDRRVPVTTAWREPK
ncbi:NAD+ synthase [Jonesiaceae bacterium BS-20]|uniref:Glutamine-dependent NAD(+) synthetase n=1 Tax=Jonesiaceae bacterium BS-20 TaxID=3120821 RepID=A0AAU7DQW6_9MICO